MNPNWGEQLSARRGGRWGATIAPSLVRWNLDELTPTIDALAGAERAVVHTDGGCEPNPGRGGWGVTIDAPGRPAIELWGGVDHTTNNRMELTAAVIALSVLPPAASTSIVSDSQYLVRGMTEWLSGWRSRGFRRGDGHIPNHDLWLLLDSLSRGRRIGWNWVRGHSGHAGNQRADRLAARGMREPKLYTRSEQLVHPINCEPPEAAGVSSFASTS